MQDKSLLYGILFVVGIAILGSLEFNASKFVNTLGGFGIIAIGMLVVVGVILLIEGSFKKLGFEWKDKYLIWLIVIFNIVFFFWFFNAL